MFLQSNSEHRRGRPTCRPGADTPQGRKVAQPFRAAIAGLKPCATLVLIAIAVAASAQTRTDWTQWRGPNRDGAIASFTAPKAWPDALTRKWKVDVGIGYA